MDKRIWDFDSSLEFNDDDLIPVAIDNGDGTYTTMSVSGAILREYINPESPTPNLGPVLDNTITDPSTLTPEEGDRYIVPTGAVNDWLGQDGNIAQWDDFAQEWTYYIPVDEDKTIVTTGSNAGNVYEFNGISWIEVIVPVVNNSPFFLAGTAIDAGGDKTSRIARTGDVLIGSTSSSLNSKLVINGKTIANAYATRTGFASTSDITRTGKWYRIMSFDCNYSIYATHHFKIILGFNGNSNGTGFVAELDINIKRQNTQIFVSSVIRQSINTAEIIYEENDRNIEFLWNNTTKRVTLYFRPDQNYSALSLTILNPRETANTRFSFLNQYTNATDLTGEVSDALTEKNIIMGDVIGVNFTTPILKRRILNELSNDYSQFIQNAQLFGLSAAYGDGSYDAQYIFSPQQFSFGISDNANSVTNNILNSYSSNNYYLSDNLNNITNQIEQTPNVTKNSIDDNINNEDAQYQLTSNNFNVRVRNTASDVTTMQTLDVSNYQLSITDGINLQGSLFDTNLSNTTISVYSDNYSLNSNLGMTNELIEKTVTDITSDLVRLTVTQTVKDFSLRFQDNSIGLDNKVEFTKTRFFLPDGYNIESSLQSDPDTVSFISVGDSSTIGQAIKLSTSNSVFGTNSDIVLTPLFIAIGGTTDVNINTTENISLLVGAGKNITLSNLPSYINDAAADADPNLPSGALYKLTGSRAVYQKP